MTRHLNDLTGRTFGRWTVIDRVPPVNKSTMWLALCTCGRQEVVGAKNLLTGRSRSCGCARGHVPHGMSRRAEYRIWSKIKGRCNNPRDKAWRDYGGRGIRVDPRWRGFLQFFADMGPRPTPAHSIERLDVNGNYAPENCCWIPMNQQSVNRRTTIRLTVNGETHTIREWSQITGLTTFCIKTRLRLLRWSVEKTILTPPNPSGRGPKGPRRRR